MREIRVSYLNSMDTIKSTNYEKTYKIDSDDWVKIYKNLDFLKDYDPNGEYYFYDWINNEGVNSSDIVSSVNGNKNIKPIQKEIINKEDNTIKKEDKNIQPVVPDSEDNSDSTGKNLLGTLGNKIIKISNDRRNRNENMSPEKKQKIMEDRKERKLDREERGDERRIKNKANENKPDENKPDENKANENKPDENKPNENKLDEEIEKEKEKLEKMKEDEEILKYQINRMKKIKEAQNLQKQKNELPTKENPPKTPINIAGSSVLGVGGLTKPIVSGAGAKSDEIGNMNDALANSFIDDTYISTSSDNPPAANEVAIPPVPDSLGSGVFGFINNPLKTVGYILSPQKRTEDIEYFKEKFGDNLPDKLTDKAKYRKLLQNQINNNINVDENKKFLLKLDKSLIEDYKKLGNFGINNLGIKQVILDSISNVIDDENHENDEIKELGENLLENVDRIIREMGEENNSNISPDLAGKIEKYGSTLATVINAKSAPPVRPDLPNANEDAKKKSESVSKKVTKNIFKYGDQFQ